MQQPIKVRDVYKKLQEFREAKDAKEAEKKEEERRIQEQKIELERTHTPKRLNFLESSAIDLLDIYPLRKWRHFKDQHPLQCWIMTVTLWLVGQILAIHVEFGLVFTLLSLFLLMFLQLGVRAEGEMSAYSVFNPNCERLLGQMTPEHFERDMLMQRKEN